MKKLIWLVIPFLILNFSNTRSQPAGISFKHISKMEKLSALKDSSHNIESRLYIGIGNSFEFSEWKSNQLIFSVDFALLFSKLIFLELNVDKLFPNTSAANNYLISIIPGFHFDSPKINGSVFLGAGLGFVGLGFFIVPLAKYNCNLTQHFDIGIEGKPVIGGKGVYSVRLNLNLVFKF